MHVMQTWRAFFDETSSDSANVKKESNIGNCETRGARS